MEFRGRLRARGDSGQGIAVDLRLDDIFLELETEGEPLGRWRLDEISVDRIAGKDFSLTMDDEELVFVADDALGFAYEGLAAIEETLGRIKKRRRSRRSKQQKAAPILPEQPAAEEGDVRQGYLAAARAARSAEEKSSGEVLAVSSSAGLPPIGTDEGAEAPADPHGFTLPVEAAAVSYVDPTVILVVPDEEDEATSHAAVEPRTEPPVPAAANGEGPAPGPLEPEGSSEPVESLEPEGSSEPVESLEPEGSSEPVEALEPEGSSEPVEALEPEGSSEPVEAPGSEGSSEPVETALSNGRASEHLRRLIAESRESASPEEPAVRTPQEPPARVPEAPPTDGRRSLLEVLSRRQQEHDHVYEEGRTVSGITRRVCSVCGHVSFGSENVYGRDW